MPFSPDDIVRSSFALYDTLPSHGKPKPRSNGVPEWSILSTIHLYNPSSSSIIPISLGTGVKCLPANRLPPLGDVLHDSHAEVLARRGFVRWLIEEARWITLGEKGLGVLEYVRGKFRLKDEMQVWMYVSALPVRSTLRLAMSS
jgi:tRNA-specific adenosine deaminase 1